jgi:hypothetical protein
LNTIKINATRMDVCSTLGAMPTYANVTAASLATTTATGDFTLAAGSPSGRQVTVAAKSGISVTVTGTAAEVVLSNGNLTVYFSTTLSASQGLTSLSLSVSRQCHLLDVSRATAARLRSAQTIRAGSGNLNIGISGVSA